MKNIRDFFELWFFPGLALFFSWNFTFKLFKFFSKNFKFLYKESVDSSFFQAKKLGYINFENEENWRFERRLMTLVDHADMYLSIKHGDNFIDKYVDIDGSFPSFSDSTIACTFHWGAGMWLYHYVKMNNWNMSTLVAPLDRNAPPFKDRPFLYFYIKRRVSELERASGEKSIDVSKNLRDISDYFLNKKQILFLADVPSDQASRFTSVFLGEYEIFVPNAMFKKTIAKKNKFVFFIVGLDFSNGRRFLRVEEILFSDEKSLIDSVFIRFNELINERSSAWHLWSEIPRFMRGNNVF